MMASPLRLGTRGSFLARTQSGQVADELMRLHPGLVVELVILKTTGDRITDRPLADMGGKGLFTRELEQALLDHRVDFVVHSYKDVPITMPLVDQGNLMIPSVPKRADPRDVIVIDTKAYSPALVPGHLSASQGAGSREMLDIDTKEYKPAPGMGDSLKTDDPRPIQRPPATSGGLYGENIIHNLPQGAVIGTGSLRRRCQLLDLRDDLDIQGVRGNIDTRLKKLREGSFHAILLALAGLERAGMFDPHTMFPLDPALMTPSAGQGALALQCRADDESTRRLLAVMDDPTTRRCVEIERAVVLALNGDCHSPIAAHATLVNDHLHLRAAVGASGGRLPVIRAQATDIDPEKALAGVLADLRQKGV